MKRVIFTLVLVATTILGANAQWYLGGSLGFKSNSEETNTDPKSGFGVVPEIGYYLNDKFDIGLDFGFSSFKNQNDKKGSSWAIAPYARYSFFQVGKFETLAKGSVFFGGTDGFMLDNTFYDRKFTTFGVEVAPLLTYGLTDKVVLFSQLNFLKLNFASITPDGGDAGTSFGLGVDTNDVTNTGNIQIGFVYKF